MKSMKYLLGLILLNAVLIGLPLFFIQGKKKDQDDPLAIVNGTPITEATFRYWWDRETPPEDTAANREALLDQLIQRTSLANRAREAGLDQDPAIVEAIESLLVARLKEEKLQPAIEAIEIKEKEARDHYEKHR
ncbi:MAG: SurA N-terminal domain-containing protein, partial [Verrucomicrobiota bacterium]